MKISLTEAKKKTPSGMFEKLSEFVARVACDVDSIQKMVEAPEVMAEYKANGLNLAKASMSVIVRHEKEEAERKAAEERTERQKREAEAVAKVEAAAPVVAPPVAVEAPEKIYPCIPFKLINVTKSQAIKVREFLKQEGIEYE